MNYLRENFIPSPMFAINTLPSEWKNLNAFQRVMVMFQLFMLFLDLSSDALVAHAYYVNGQTGYFGISLLIFILSFFFMLFGLLEKRYESLKSGIELVKYFEALVEAAPQAIIQIYNLLRGAIRTYRLFALSIILSIFSMCTALTKFEVDFDKLLLADQSFFAKSSVFLTLQLSRLSEVISRIACLGLFAYASSGYGVLLLLLFEWIVLGIVIYNLGTAGTGLQSHYKDYRIAILFGYLSLIFVPTVNADLDQILFSGRNVLSPSWGVSEYTIYHRILLCLRVLVSGFVLVFVWFVYPMKDRLLSYDAVDGDDEAYEERVGVWLCFWFFAGGSAVYALLYPLANLATRKAQEFVVHDVQRDEYVH